MLMLITKSYFLKKLFYFILKLHKIIKLLNNLNKIVKKIIVNKISY